MAYLLLFSSLFIVFNPIVLITNYVKMNTYYRMVQMINRHSVGRKNEQERMNKKEWE